MTLNPKNHKKADGFTLIQLIIALAIVTSIASIGVTFQKLLGNMVCTSYAHEVAAVINRAHSKAALSGDIQRIYLSTSHGITPDSSLGSPLPFPTGVYCAHPEGALGPPSRPRTPLTSACTWKRTKTGHVLEVYPSGCATSGTLYLMTRNAGRAYAISTTTNRMHGVRIYSWKNGRWELFK